MHMSKVYLYYEYYTVILTNKKVGLFFMKLQINFSSHNFSIEYRLRYDEENIFHFYNYLTNYNAPMFICKFFFCLFPQPSEHKLSRFSLIAQNCNKDHYSSKKVTSNKVSRNVSKIYLTSFSSIYRLNDYVNTSIGITNERKKIMKIIIF